MKCVLSKKDLREAKEARKIIAKRVKQPGFFKTLPEAEKTVSKWKI